MGDSDLVFNVERLLHGLSRDHEVKKTVQMYGRVFKLPLNALDECFSLFDRLTQYASVKGQGE